ncbi:MAG: DUF3307 domain-containing protein [Bacteroidetes bacterium]|jgi:hypothetical protein|nr:DUF3307 domain-containing protein [Bacteroidota bacterium]
MFLIKLILAHIIGDFFLQKNNWIESKEKKTWRSGALYGHVLIHFLLILLIFYDLSLWPLALIIAATHFLIDLTKLTFQRKGTRHIWFVADQVAHLLVLVVVWFLYTEPQVTVDFSNSFWVILTGVLILTYPSAYTIENLMAPWSREIDESNRSTLSQAGLYIGILERIFTYVAVLIGSFSIIGFLLAAKSVFRFGDLRKADDRTLTEYVLIGTMISFLIAFLTGLATRWLLH